MQCVRTIGDHVYFGDDGANIKVLDLNTGERSFIKKNSGMLHKTVWDSAMRPVRLRHSIREIATQPVVLWIELGGKPKWLPLNFGFNDVMPKVPV